MVRIRISDISSPRQVALVSAEAEAEVMGKRGIKKNIITVAWHTPLSFEPPMYAVSIGKTRFSCELIRKSKCFAVNFMPHSLSDKALHCGRNSGQYVNKFREFGLEEEESEKIHCPRIKEALAFLECEVVEEVDAGDHILFVGRVVNMGRKKEDKRLFHTGGDEFTTTVK
ncbi:MAG: flavin reductase family protein [Candidatus Woesearchaeota archaeon]